MPLAPGSRLGPYQVTALLGSGGMGEVYRARDPRLGRDVAIKVLPTAWAADADPSAGSGSSRARSRDDRLRRFEQEAHTVAALNHPNILALFDIGTHKGAPYLITELLEGATLRDRLGGGPLPSGTVVELAAQLASGLAAAHAKGIVHRDLKPENVFVTREGHVKILDFGLAKHFASVSSGSQTELPTEDIAGGTQAGVLLGTVGYMSPEQVRRESVDARSDIFSFGCVLFEMLSGHKAFQKKTTLETLTAILTEEPPPLVPSSAGMPVNLERIVRRCLEKRPEDRFASASDLHFALQSLLHAPISESASKEPPEKSIVVLPFENLSPDPDNAYFADGLTEEIISDLAKVRALRVISRTSAMLLRGSKKDVPTLARELNVRYVLEGSVRRAGQSLRIAAQLIDAASDVHLWAEKYSGTVEDVFDMQEKVSRAIVESLKLELTPQELQRMAERPIPNLYAYECYLRARREIFRFTEPALDKAMEYLEEGLRVLPDNPLLLAGMAYVHRGRVESGVGQEDSLEKAEEFAKRAVALAPDLPQGHLQLGLIAFWGGGRIKTAVAHIERALAADPNDWDALAWAGAVYPFLGKTCEVASVGERLIAMDPLSAMSYMPLLWSHWLDGRFDLALGVLERNRQQRPVLLSTSLIEAMRVMTLIPMGRHEEAIASAEHVEKEERLIITHRMALLWRYAVVGDRQRALSWMTSETVRTCRRDFLFSWWVACAYAMLGDADTALDWLENAVNLGFMNYRYLGEIDPLLAPLRGDPRFQALIARARENKVEFEGRS
jgi:eukaryotic-like serine/threonine-protein kinase